MDFHGSERIDAVITNPPVTNLAAGSDFRDATIGRFLARFLSWNEYVLRLCWAKDQYDDGSHRPTREFAGWLNRACDFPGVANALTCGTTLFLSVRSQSPFYIIDSLSIEPDFYKSTPPDGSDCNDISQVGGRPSVLRSWRDQPNS